MSAWTGRLPGAYVVVAMLIVSGGPLVLGTVGGAAFFGHRAPASTLAPTAGSVRHSFAFVSTFADHRLDGWSPTRGHATVVTSPNHDGEPALQSVAPAGGAQVDSAHRGIATGAHSVSFEAYVSLSSGAEAFVGLAGSSGPVAVIGVSGSTVWAGSSPATAVSVGTVPSSSAQPAGWVWLLGNVYRSGSTNASPWKMDVYVDETDLAVRTGVSVPGAANYSAGVLRTTNGTAWYTDIIVSSYAIARVIPGYNNMDGYGEGSGGVVQRLPAFTTLSSTMVLHNWSTPQTGELSIQINAMNLTGTVFSTCHGFFQLGVDIDPSGYISPWYVRGNDCIAHYFGHPGIWSGFASPAGTTLTLTITDNTSASAVDFTIVDQSVSGTNHRWHAAIHYTRGPFYGVYTQMEFQPCCNNYPIGAFHLNATLSNVTIDGGTVLHPTPLTASYMLPYVLDVPPSWNMNYFATSSSSYDQTA